MVPSATALAKTLAIVSRVSMFAFDWAWPASVKAFIMFTLLGFFKLGYSLSFFLAASLASI